METRTLICNRRGHCRRGSWQPTLPRVEAARGQRSWEQAARDAGGDSEIESTPGEGTRMKAMFQLSHPIFETIDQCRIGPTGPRSFRLVSEPGRDGRSGGLSSGSVGRR